MDMLFYRFLVVYLIFLTSSLQVKVYGADDNTLRYISEHLQIKYNVVDNIFSDSKLKAQLILTNTGSTEIKKGDWSIFFCHVRMMEPDHLPNPNGTILGTSGMKVSHVNGCLFKLETTADFKTLSEGQKVEIPFQAQYWQVARTDITPNWYVAAENMAPRVVLNTATELLDFVGPFNTKEKWKRAMQDKYNPFTPRTRFERIKIKHLKPLTKRIVPCPQEDHLNRNGESINIRTGDWVVFSSANLANEAKILSDKLGMPIVKSTPSHRYVSLHLGDFTSATIPSWSREESYHLDIQVKNELINITGKTAAAVFYGIQSLISLTEESSLIPNGYIVDYPRFPYRGLHFDVARNFHGLSVVKRVLDVMAMYKLNKFHFHLTDDEGWRLEIPGLSELTSIAGRRCHDLQETECLIPQYGSGPITGTRGTGFYTVQQYKEILQYAMARHIEVIPEFDMPGHIHAAVKAMEARYKKHAAAGNPTAAKEFMISDLKDTSDYLSIQMWKDNAMNPCVDSTYKFVEHVINETINMHKNVHPLKIFHFGGDEVAKGAWMDSPSCKRLMAQEKFNKSEDLKEHFVKRLAEIAAKNSLALGGWEDGLMGEGGVPYDRNGLKNIDIYSNAWQNIWEWGAGKRAYLLANAGYKVILSHATHFYFDHPYEPNPEERGFYWATRYTDTRKTFGFTAEDIYRNIDVDRFGKPLTTAELCKKGGDCPQLQIRKNIIGIQGQLWSETIRTDGQVESMLFPRLLALAERAWYKAKWESTTDRKQRDAEIVQDWEKFANVLGQKELARLDKMGIRYRIPVPGAVYGKNGLEAKTEFPGLTIQFSENGGKTWTEYNQPTLLDGKSHIQVKTRSADYRRESRIVTVAIPVSGAKPDTLFCGLLCSVVISVVIQMIICTRHELI